MSSTRRCLTGRTGNLCARDLSDYHIFSTVEMPEQVTLFVKTFEPSHPFGVKAVGEIGIVGIASAVVNAIHDTATGVWRNEIPATPERVLACRRGTSTMWSSWR